MFLLALSELWHWTGNLAYVARYKDTALRALEWARRFGDRDGDGFLEYVKRSPRGLKNQAWKDSDEAIRYPDGSMVENPIATVEEQAYYCVALQRMSELLFALGDEGPAEGFLQTARRLKRRWHEAFWVEEDGFYALALDPDKRPVRSIASNPGHALAAGLVPRERARQVADRLMAPDLFSGWGIRTLDEAPFLQSTRLSPRHGVACRERHLRRRLQTLRPRRAPRPAGHGHVRGRQLLRRLSSARGVLGRRTDRDRGAHPLPWRLQPQAWSSARRSSSCK